MTLTLVTGNKNYSSWSLRGWLVAKHSGLEFSEIRIALNESDYKDAIKQYSRAGKVPVLIVRDEESPSTDMGNGYAIWDSLAIAEYFATKNPSLWPENEHDRALARSVSAEMHSSFIALRSAMPMNCRARNRKIEMFSDLESDISRIKELWSDCLRARGVISGPWLFGRWSIADAMYAPVVSRFMTYEVSLEAELAQYADTVLTDPAMEEWYASALQESEVIESEEAGL